MTDRTANQSGFILIYTVVALLLLAGLVLAGTGRLQSMEDVSSLRFAHEGQARQVANSGLLHAEAWIRAQPRQPVKAFAPVRDLSSSPQIDETDEPDVGLVRSFQIAPGVWGRYTVRKGAADEPFTDANGNGLHDPGERFEDWSGDGVRTMAYGARDISARHGAAAGMVWRVESDGEIFLRPREDLPLDERPNHRVAAIVLATNVGRAGFSLPATAGLITTEAEETKLKSKTAISSPTLGIGYRDNTGTPNLHKKTNIDAPSKHAALEGLEPGVAVYDKKGKRVSEKGVENPIAVEEVFGITLAEMRGMADIVRSVTKKSSKAAPPITVPHGATAVITVEAGKSKAGKTGKETLKVKGDWPITGQGILVIDGNVEADKLGIDFEGVIFITGSAKLKDCRIRGMLVVAGSVEISGNPGKSGKSGKSGEPSIVHDPALVAELLGFTGEYRQVGAAWRPAPMAPDGRPLDSLLNEDRPLPPRHGRKGP